jgi:hypothetical protein
MTSFIVSFLVKTQNVPEVAFDSVIRLQRNIVKPSLLGSLIGKKNPMQPKEQVSYSLHFAP